MVRSKAIATSVLCDYFIHIFYLLSTDSIDYVEYAYAIKNNLKSALVQNKRGEFVAPSLESANAALSTVTFPDNYRVFVGDPGQGYPIVGLTWIMVYKQYANASKADAIKKWINWVLKDNQQYNDDLNYTKIPSDVANRVLQTVNSSVKPYICNLITFLS